MKKYYKILAFTLALVIAFGSAGILVASAEETTYTQPEKFIYGDVDLDGSVTVKDATLIQKGLAKVTYVTAVQRYLADPEGTGYSVKNATAIQKYLAKYETTTPWNTEIPMASQDEFSGAVDYNAQYADDTIILMIKTTNSRDYSLKDFPEYDFASVEKITKLKPHMYRLKLTNHSKENVIEAIKALDYRANLDLLYASPDYIFKVDLP